VDDCELLDELASVPDGEIASHASSAQKDSYFILQ